MKFLPKNTLAYFNAAPQTHLHDLSDLPTAVFAAATKKYRVNCGTASPNEAAVTFYTLNHCASIVREMFTENEVLPEWAKSIMNVYTDACMDQGERLLHYLLSITTRETRHMHSGTAAFWSTVKAQWDQSSVDLLKNISSNSNEELAVKKYMDTPPDVTIGQYVKTIAYGFHHGSYSGGYGGEPWGLTTDALVAMIHGETSMEMMVDTGYTLAHNGGPIFDKGMMYSHYGADLLTVLDVQRSGQMIDLMEETQTMGIHKTPEAVAAVGLIKLHCADKFKGYVDWKLVDVLRPAKDKNKSPHKYDKVTGVQKQPMKAKPAATVKAPKPVAPKAPLLVDGKAVKVTGTYQVFPHQTVTTYERVK